MFKIKVITGIFLAAFSTATFADEIDDLLENKEGLPAEELQEKISAKRNELWKQYLKEKEDKEKTIVNKDGQVENGLTEGEQALQPKGQSPSDYTEGMESLQTQKRFACIKIGNVRGVSLSDKMQFAPVIDGLGDYQLIFAIDNTSDFVYLNDGTNKPFMRIKPNIFQRNITLINGNELLDSWVLDTQNRKAMFSQIKSGADLGNSIKSMTGDIVSFNLLDDCNNMK